MTIERYSHVMHIVSKVPGRSRGRRALDALAACSPRARCPGAPKIRAMQIIDELEPVRRGPYGGAVGYLSFADDLDVNIALRTLFVKDGAMWTAGGGASSRTRCRARRTRGDAQGARAALGDRSWRARRWG